MKLKGFEEITRTILAENRTKFVDAYLKGAVKDNTALLVLLEKDILKGKSDAKHFIVSPTHNQPLYDKLPEDLKRKLYDKDDKTYIIFVGWDSMVTSYILTKD